MTLRHLIDRTLAGFVLVGRRAIFHLEGEDRRGRVWARRCSPTGAPRGPLVVVHPDRWAQLERVLARLGRGQ